MRKRIWHNISINSDCCGPINPLVVGRTVVRQANVATRFRGLSSVVTIAKKTKDSNAKTAHIPHSLSLLSRLLHMNTQTLLAAILTRPSACFPKLSVCFLIRMSV